MRQSRQAFSSQDETLSELLYGYLHPSARDMILPPIWLRCLSSENLWQGAREHLARCPSSGGSPGSHRRRPLSVPLRQSFATSFSRLRKCHSQRCMRTDKMIVRSPPLQIGQQMWRLLRRSPGPASERCYAMTDGQIHALNKSRIQPSRKA